MSLVYEALQKAGREKERKTSHVPAPPPAQVVAKPPATTAAPRPAAAPAPAPRTTHWLIALVTLVAVVAIVAIVWLVKISPTPVAKPAADGGTRSVASDPATVATPAQPATPPATTTANDPRFRLTGIMGNPEAGFGAVINGKTVYEGHYVDGAIVKQIARNYVILNQDGHEIMLRLF
jgi:hypothetical protein